MRARRRGTARLRQGPTGPDAEGHSKQDSVHVRLACQCDNLLGERTVFVPLPATPDGVLPPRCRSPDGARRNAMGKQGGALQCLAQGLWPSHSVAMRPGAEMRNPQTPLVAHARAVSAVSKEVAARDQAASASCRGQLRPNRTRKLGVTMRIFADWLFLVDGDVRFWSTTTVRIMTSRAAPSGEPIKVYWQPG